MISSPLRYPGGKSRLFDFVSSVVSHNQLYDHVYCEPYAGGGGLALKLLVYGYVKRIVLNDIDPTIFCFWKAALENNEEFCEMVDRTPVTVDEWFRQRQIRTECDTENVLKLGFSTYFLNRTNRSGIIDGAGPIGGYEQLGKWKIDARFIKDKQIANLRYIGKLRKQITISCYDALEFISINLPKADNFTYLDPPYYVKGSKLYRNSYRHSDHVEISNTLLNFRDKRWILTYDSVDQIMSMYDKFTPYEYLLDYSVGDKCLGSEVLYASDEIKITSAPRLY